MSIQQNSQKRLCFTVQISRERIQKTRISKNISQKQMAEMLGISQPAYSQMESGKYPDMRVSTLINICNILDVSIEWLLGSDKPEPYEVLEKFYMDTVDVIARYDEEYEIKNISDLLEDITKLYRRYDDMV